jgi:hypothetical protein
MVQSTLIRFISFVPKRKRARISAIVLAFAVTSATLWTIDISNRAATLADELKSTAGAAQSTIGTADADALARHRAELAESSPFALKREDDIVRFDDLYGRT